MLRQTGTKEHFVKTDRRTVLRQTGALCYRSTVLRQKQEHCVKTEAGALCYSRDRSIMLQ